MTHTVPVEGKSLLTKVRMVLLTSTSENFVFLKKDFDFTAVMSCLTGTWLASCERMTLLRMSKNSIVGIQRLI